MRSRTIGRLCRRSSLVFGIIVAYAIVQLVSSNYRLSRLPLPEQKALAPTTERLNIFTQQRRPKTTLNRTLEKDLRKKREGPQPLLLKPGPIFYNIYVPPTKDLSHVEQILREQLTQRNWTSPNDTILYTLIGNNNLKQTIDAMCQPNCHLRQHLPNGGDERDTLQALWDYCHNIITPPSKSDSIPEDTLVTYIHDKGSFHPTESNEKSRRMGTKAALECRNLMPNNPRYCTICTSVFHVFPQYLGSSNMWTARCSYIRGLIPPNKYPDQLQQMYDTTLNNQSALSDTKYACLKPNRDSPNYLGLGRYALERWPFSHPHVNPCDVLPIGEGQVEPEFPQTSWIPNLKRAPRDKAAAVGIKGGPYKASFARLAGRLFEWHFLYGKAPQNNSWVWKWYRGYEEGTNKWMEECREKEKNTKRGVSLIS